METAGVEMAPTDEPRVWAKRDRTKAPPQRELARRMRGTPTEAERKLWWHLRHRLGTAGTHFRRQVQIGRYIVDFACHANRVIIEVDGGQHATQSVADAARTGVLQANGYRVLRYWNNDILKNIDGVLEDIHRAIESDPHPQPLRTRGRGAHRMRCTSVRQGHEQNTR
jgi:very-short-patch-repair endonuclease